MSVYNSDDFDECCDIIDNFDNIKLDDINLHNYQFHDLEYNSYDNYVLLKNLNSKIPFKKLIYFDNVSKYIEKLNSIYFERLIEILDLSLYEYRYECYYLKKNYLKIYNTILDSKQI